MTIAEIIAAAQAGVPLTEIIPKGSDIKMWQRLLNRTPDEAKKRKGNRRNSSGRPSKRTNYAERVLGRDTGLALAQLAKRVNDEGKSDE